MAATLTDKQRAFAKYMAAGFPKTNTLRLPGYGQRDLLSVMSDGRWWTRPVLKQVFARRQSCDAKRDYDWLKGSLMRAWRRGWIERAANPMFDGVDSREQVRRMTEGKGSLLSFMTIDGGARKCRYIYQITDAGRDRLAAYRAVV